MACACSGVFGGAAALYETRTNILPEFITFVEMVTCIVVCIGERYADKLAYKQTG